MPKKLVTHSHSGRGRPCSCFHCFFTFWVPQVELIELMPRNVSNLHHLVAPPSPVKLICILCTGVEHFTPQPRFLWQIIISGCFEKSGAWILSWCYAGGLTQWLFSVFPPVISLLSPRKQDKFIKGVGWSLLFCLTPLHRIANECEQEKWWGKAEWTDTGIWGNVSGLTAVIILQD